MQHPIQRLPQGFLCVVLVAALTGCASSPAVTVIRPGPIPVATLAATNETVQIEAANVKAQGEKIIEDIAKRKASAEAILKQGDAITLQIWLKDKTSQFSGFPQSQAIDATGSIFVPGMGSVVAEGRTEDELRQVLMDHFSKILKDPTVVVSRAQRIANWNGDRNPQNAAPDRYVAILGRIASPGLYGIEGTRYTLRDLIARAGGTKEFADVKQVYLVRGSVRMPEVVVINLSLILTGEDMTGNYLLEHADAVYVPPVTMYKVYEGIRTILLPITAVRDAVWIFPGY